MTSHIPPYQVYNVPEILTTAAKATQVRHLAVIGLAARNSIWNLRDIDEACISLFEVIAQLAHEIEYEACLDEEIHS